MVVVVVVVVVQVLMLVAVVLLPRAADRTRTRPAPPLRAYRERIPVRVAAVVLRAAVRVLLGRSSRRVDDGHGGVAGKAGL